jgi:acetyl esterase
VPDTEEGVDYDVDPELAEVLPLLRHLPLDTAADVEAARAIEADVLRPTSGHVDTTGLTVVDCAVPGVGGQPDVPGRVYRPAAANPGLPALVLIHGGGFVLGTLDGVHADATALARALDAVVVAVGYRLAPEHPYPAALEDCWAVLCWLAGAGARELGVDRDRIGVLGRSAGGGLAAGLALLARDRGGPALCTQHLFAPMLDDRMETPSMRAFTDTPSWDRPSTAACWAHYLRGRRALTGGSPAANVPAYAAPARATDLRGLPPAHITAMEYDPLRDEAVLYALGLLEAGVHVELHMYPRTFHAAALVRTAAVARRIEADVHASLRRALHDGPAAL